LGKEVESERTQRRSAEQKSSQTDSRLSLVILESEGFQSNVKSLNEQLNKKSDELITATHEIERLKCQLRTIETNQSTLDKQLQDIGDRHQYEMNSKDHQLTEKRNFIEELQLQLESLRTQVTPSNYGELEQQVTELKAKNDSINQRICELETYEKERNSLLEQILSLQMERDSLTQKIETMTRDQKDIESAQIKQLQDQIHQLKENKRNLESVIEKLEQSSRSEKAVHEDTVSSLQAEVSSLSEQYQSLHTQMSQEKLDYNQGTDQEVLTLRNQIVSLEETIASMLRQDQHQADIALFPAQRLSLPLTRVNVN
jgi:chromosome segregation ATPase